MLPDLYQFNVSNKLDSATDPKTFALTIPVTATVRLLQKRIAEKTDRKEEWFEMMFEDSTIMKEEDLDKPLNEFKFSDENPNSINLNPTPAYKQAKIDNPLLGAEEEIPEYADTFAPATNFLTKSSTGFVGLANQGATCYLNSLIQALYMTPEFRSALYEWSFEDHCHSDFTAKLADKGIDKLSFSDEKYRSWKAKYEEKSIPRQLQKLFIRLQLSNNRSCETKDLTTAFGWANNEVFAQHDVQEVCRVFFDALEQVWRGTPKENTITQLYQGEMKDYVKCLRCSNENSRRDTFLDVPLVIKGFGAIKAVESVQEAIGKFVEPETLSGDNQYFCSHCNCKADAEKGLKFTALPYILTLQLKRFEFDFETLNRVKLNDSVTFPEILDMNCYLQGEGITPLVNSIQEDLFVSNEAAQKKRQEVIEAALARGPHVYELFSILVHKGNAAGGHYYAYIKYFKNGKWYCFNDSSVSDATSVDVKESFGGDSNRGVGAYMLLYRLIDPQRNKIDVAESEITEEMKIVVKEEHKVEEVKQQERERKKQMTKLKLHHKKHLREIELHRDEAMQTATVEAAKQFSLEAYLPDRIRLRDYNTIYETLGKPYTGELLQKSLFELSIHFSKSFFVETVEEGEQFPEYNPDFMTLKISVFDANNGSWSEHQLVPVPREATLGELKQIIETKFSIPLSEQLIVKQEYQSGKIIPDLNEKLLKDVDITHEGVKLMVEPRMSEEEKKTFNIEDNVCRALLEIDRANNALDIYFSEEGGQEHKFSTTKTITVNHLKKYISEKLSLPLDFMKLTTITTGYPKDLDNDHLTLAEFYLAGECRILVGKQMININFVRFEPNIKETQVEKLFTLPLPASLTVKEAKSIAFNHFQKLQESEETKRKDNFTLAPPERLRLRRMFMYLPDRIFLDTDVLRDITKIYKEIAIQNLPEGVTEMKTQSNTFIFIQKFDPQTFTLSPKIEIEISESQPISEFKSKLAQITGIENAVWTAVDGWEVKMLQLPEATWYDGTEEKHRNEIVKLFGFSDGDLLLYKDPTIPTKELNEEEQKQIQAEETKHDAIQKASYQRKEAQFKITIQDVALDD